MIFDLYLPAATANRMNKNFRYEVINGVVFPKKGRSFYEETCSCGKKKYLSTELDSDGCYLCRDCD